MSSVELQEFFVEGRNQDESHVLLHITEPSTPEEQKKGYFFALAEINNGTLKHIEHLQQLIDDLESGFYATTGDKNEDAFEATLEYMNRRGSQILSGKTKVHIFVGVIHDSILSFAHHGDMHALLFYRHGETSKLMDLLEGSEGPEKEQLFSSVVQGSLNSGDFLFVATPKVADYFSYDRLHKIISSRSINQSTAHIEKVLKDIQANSSFGGIIFRLLSKQKRIIEPIETKNNCISEKSLNQLLNSRKKTAETLSPPILKQLITKAKKRISNSGKQKIGQPETKKERGKVETNFRYRADRSPNQSMSSTILIGLGRALVTIGTGIFKSIHDLAVLLGKGIIAIFIIITNKNNSRKDVIRTMQKNVEKKKQFFEDLPAISKILFIATIFFGIIFLCSILFIKIKENYQAEREQYKNMVQNISDKKDVAEASLIYENQEKAFLLLKEAEELVKELPENKKVQREIKDELSTDIESLMMTLRKLEIIEPELLVDLKQQFQNINVTNLERIDDKLIAFGPSDQNIYMFDIYTNKVETTKHVDTIKLTRSDTPKEQDSIIFLDNNSSVAVFDKESKIISKKEINFPEKSVNISDAVIYNLRLYTIDKENNQIYKHSKTQLGYDKGTPWLKDQYNLGDATAIAIDGDLFVSKSNGEIYKFVSGVQEEFNVSGIDPKLENPTDIYTYNDINNIYIFEPTNKRVVILDKKGKLIRQYSAVIWEKPTAMIVDEKNNTIFILDSGKIYKFEVS